MEEVPFAQLMVLAEELLATTCARFPIEPPPKIEWRGFRVTAGMAYYRTFTIGLSSYVLRTPEQLHTTLLHEYAHLLAVARHGKKAGGHGPEWRQAMHDLGQEPKRTHNYEVQKNNKWQRVGYQCLKCAVVFERARRLPSNRRYLHAKCGGGLKLVYVRPNADPDSRVNNAAE